MTIAGRRDAIILFIGDILIFILSLWLMLFLRRLEVPAWYHFKLHLIPFSLLFLVWLLVFFIAGLYGKHTLVLKRKLPTVIFNTQLFNMIIAAVFFFLVPYFVIAPKTTLFIYLIVSFPLILWWRLSGQDILTSREPESALLIGNGSEMNELRDEVNHNSKYGLKFVSYIDTEKLSTLDFKGEILPQIYSQDISVIVLDLKSDKLESILPHLYNLLFAKIKFIDLSRIYEDIFDRIPLSLLRHNWFIENISLSPKLLYDILKRAMDIVISSLLLILSLPLYPIVYMLIKTDDGGEFFSYQKRVGQYNRQISIIKFRTMTVANDNGEWNKTDNKVTKIGTLLRRSRVDELPQLWNVLKGDLSLIGPRPEFESAVNEYRAQIPYYNIRHLIKPGLSGWAQVYHENHPHHGLDIEETKNKLSHDLFYVKNRSLILDFYIALRTVQTLLSRSGI